MRRHAWGLLLVLLSAAPSWAERAEEEAGDVSEVDKDATGPLRDRIRPVSGHLFLMEGRFELSPEVGISFRDAFFTKVLLGAAATYHFSEAFAASLRAAYVLSLISGSAQICYPPGSEEGDGCQTPTMDQITGGSSKAVGLMRFLGSVDLEWAPIYGKLALFAANVLYFNMYGLVGPAVVMYGPNNRFTVGGNLGLGFRFRLNQWLAIRLELRDTLFAEAYDTGTQDASGREIWASPLRNQLTAELGLSMFFPTTFVER